MYRHDQLAALLKELRTHRYRLSEKFACIGFDGYVDRIVNAVKYRQNVKKYQRFDTIAEYVGHLQACAGKSGDIEIVPVAEQLGGNAPIMAQAMAKLGVNSTCIGTLGDPELHPVFSCLPERCKPMSIGEPAQTLALEFNDGKIMMGEIAPLHRVTWESVLQRPGLAELTKQYRLSDVIGIVNWSSLFALDGILQGLIQEVLPCAGERVADKFIFVDIADPSARSRGEIQKLMETLREINTMAKVVLGLNRKEAELVYGAMGHLYENQAQAVLADTIRKESSLYNVVIHTSSGVTGVTEAGIWEADVFHEPQPYRTTGGGDHFNAGLCTGFMLDLPMAACLQLGNLTAAWFVRTGQSPSMDELIAFGERLLPQLI
ncbi:PfkB family carbohydrate kinase [Paenibacillus sp. MAH-36]|uniref:PfkB family carbohydrate kinase n=1 Tax=Paenibacillus violae TaxID=3077234 RepID=A0ABU3RPV6_9BACL|nr:PfkB family carbohydrate kinase [Paenibacillus sp. PFR10]MDU0206351.1 PfkB family carbohydrate kinase [Paenibacillus sp. PFR10]